MQAEHQQKAPHSPKAEERTKISPFQSYAFFACPPSFVAFGCCFLHPQQRHGRFPGLRIKRCAPAFPKAYAFSGTGDAQLSAYSDEIARGFHPFPFYPQPHALRRVLAAAPPAKLNTNAYHTTGPVKKQPFFRELSGACRYYNEV